MAEETQAAGGQFWNSAFGSFLKNVGNTAMNALSVSVGDTLAKGFGAPQVAPTAVAEKERAAAAAAAAAPSGAVEAVKKFALPIGIAGGAIGIAILVWRGKRRAANRLGYRR